MLLFMDKQIEIQLKKDFEKYMLSFYNEFKRFSLEDFGLFATTVVNYYINNKAIPLENRQDAAYFLTSLYNKGIGSRITEEHLQQISKAIASDFTIDFTVVQRVFG